MVVRSFSFGFGFLILMAFGFLRGLNLSELLNLQSLVIVIGGTILVLWLGYPGDRIRNTWSTVRHLILDRRKRDTKDVLQEIFRLSTIYRIHGPLALERALDEVKNDFLKFGSMFIIEGYDEWSLTAALERENFLRSNERRAQVGLLKTLMRLTPALGMAGTVISLMQVMQDFTRPELAGPSLGLALSSTLYGIVFANLLFLPLASKLEELANSEFMENSMIIEALRGIQRAEHPFRIAERLNAYDIYCEFKGIVGKNKVSSGVIKEAAGEKA